MSNERGPLREISWRDVCPWLVLFRTFRVAIGVQVLTLASIGATATSAGWLLSEVVFVREEARIKDPGFSAVVEANKQWPWESNAAISTNTLENRGLIEWLTTEADSILGFYTQKFVEPFRNVFRIKVTLVKNAYFLFGGLWTLAVWAFIGAAITRIAVMRLGCEERVGMKEALHYAFRKFGAYFSAPITPLIAVALLAIPLVLLGLLMKLDVGVVIAGFLWLLVVLDGLVIGVLLIGLLFGWPLMWGTVSAEGSDSFDALSRSYNYTFQRPLHYLFYVVVALLFGMLCFLLVRFFSQMVINLGYWGVSWGTGNERFDAIGSAEEGVLGFGVGVISVFTDFVYLLAGGFTYAFFWCVASAIYLLLRYNVDQTEFDEVWLEEHEQRYELPELKPDESGIPQLKKDAPEQQGSEEKVERDESNREATATNPEAAETKEQLNSDTDEPAEADDDTTGGSGGESAADDRDQDESKPSG